jgi:hypothetical protein
VELNDPPELFRVVVVGGEMRIKDEEGWGEKDEFFHGLFDTITVYLGLPQKHGRSVASRPQRISLCPAQPTPRIRTT